jgi:histidinol-phosphate/aromatic aminotransferase/cobyric acid decarboxylase-like protein
MPRQSDVVRTGRPVAELLAAQQWGAPWRAPSTEPLDLRYAPDEAELLDPTPHAICAELLGESPGLGADLAQHYAVADPYGAARGAPTVSAFFGIPVDEEQLAFGAGVTGLLRDLTPLVAGESVLAPALVHSDLEVWAASRRGTVRLLADPAPWEGVCDELRRIRPAVLHLDRPTFTGELLPLNALEQLANVAASTGTIVVVDESPATYLGAEASAVRLVPRVANLVVLRGFTKAYSLGGMRAGFSVVSREIAPRIRDLATPLQVSEIALAMALRILAAGNVFSRLVARIREMKPVTGELLRSVGLPILDGHPDLPWIAVRDDDGEHLRWLERQGVRALLPTTAGVFPDAFRTRGRGVFRLTIPLSADRLSALRERLEPSAVASTVY